ncbi:hypothetical protein [Microbacterium sp. E-13]|uniref:hypothetical protein n=1 Tax=Microbacterium sp. E-13 TaxID=3404048 RepID=UPI003CE67848
MEGSDHLVDAAGQSDLIDVVGFVQDWVTDELGTGWPELVDGTGGFTAVLAPAVVDGELVWQGRGGDAIRVGDLVLPNAVS